MHEVKRSAKLRRNFQICPGDPHQIWKNTLYLVVKQGFVPGTRRDHSIFLIRKGNEEKYHAEKEDPLGKSEHSACSMVDDPHACHVHQAFEGFTEEIYPDHNREKGQGKREGRDPG